MIFRRERHHRRFGRHKRNGNTFKFVLCIIIMILVGAFWGPFGLDSESINPNPIGKNDESNEQEGNLPDEKIEKELKHMWISYLDFQKIPKNQEGFEKSITTMFERCKFLGMNSVIVQVRSNSDAMYPSEYYPWSKFVSGQQGKDPGYDPLEYMIEAAHSRGLEFHA